MTSVSHHLQLQLNIYAKEFSIRCDAGLLASYVMNASLYLLKSLPYIFCPPVTIATPQHVLGEVSFERLSVVNVQEKHC